MKLAVAQMDSILCDVEANLGKVENLMRTASGFGAEIVIVPETFSTGFDVGDRISLVSDSIPGRITDVLAALCRELDLYFYGSLIEKAEGHYHNTGILLSPRGEILACYRKVHLFATEKRMLSPGNKAAVVKTDIGTFGLTICMDLLFPEYIRGLVLSGAEYILNSTNWLRHGPPDQWQWQYSQIRALAVTRALENTTCLAMACQWGQEGEFSKFGYSCIVSPSGRVLAGVEEGEGVAVHELTLRGVEDWRAIATYLEDRKAHIDLYRTLLDL